MIVWLPKGGRKETRNPVPLNPDFQPALVFAASFRASSIGSAFVFATLLTFLFQAYFLIPPFSLKDVSETQGSSVFYLEATD